ncbi:MAG: DUF4173 domain-containing protein [Eubacterium sp.]|nr:DUF4173 domain-containing protein [Eubacterium sp.]
MNQNPNNNGTYYAPPQGGQYQPQQQYAQPQQAYQMSQYAMHPGYYPQQNYRPYVPQKKVYKPFEKKDNLFFFLTLLASFLMLDFGLFKGVKLGFTIAYLVLFEITTVYLWKKSLKKSLFSLSCGVLSVAGAFTFSLYDNLLVNSIMFMLVFGLYGFYVLGISGCFTRKQGNFKVLFNLGYSVFIQPFEGLINVIGSAHATSKKNKRLIYTIIGVAIALPVLGIVIPLLVKSDAAFEALVGKIIKNLGIYIAEIVLAVIATPFLFSYFYNKRAEVEQKKPMKNDAHRFVVSPISIAFLSTVSLTYVVYLFSQLAYFFDAFRGILPADYEYTASAFARRGFYEMFAVCVINVLIISAVNAFTKKDGGKMSPAVKALSCFISLFSVLLIVISMQKMKLNISIYGLSANRVLVSTLMVMILIMIAFFILHIFAPKISYFQPIILICSAMFIALSFANIDARCAEYNIKAASENRIEMLDTQTIRKSSGAAIPYLIDVAKGSDKVAANSAKTQLLIYIKDSEYLEFDNNKDKVKFTGSSDFRSYNISRAGAYKGVCDYYNSLGETEKKQAKDFINMYENSWYNEEENCYESYQIDDNGTQTVYRYNPKTGLYDKTETK